jgi:phosphatidylinositol-3-phosphatase
MRRSIASAGLFALVALILGAGTAAASEDSNQGQVAKFKHVFEIMMENTGYGSLIGNPNAPWINQAAETYGLATNYYGVSHPSQPNYIAATSGGTNGVVNDNDVTINVPNIVDELAAHHKSWTAYMQSLSLCATKLDHACGNQLYERKHNPFVSYADVQSSPSRMANIVDLSQLSTDLASGHVANYVWISPDQCNDMHGRAAPATDPCNFGDVQGLISTGDTFLKNTVGQIMSSKAWTGNSAIVITWDESDFTNSGPFGFGDTSGCCDANPGGGHVVTLVINRSQDDPRTSSVAYNHYSILRTIQSSWHLGCLGFTCDKANVPTMRALLGSED